MSALAYSSVLLTTVRALGIALQAGLILSLARLLTIEEVGFIATALAAAALTRTIGPLGTDQVLMRLLGEKRPIESRVVALCSESLAVSACVGTAAGFFVVAVGLATSNFALVDLLLLVGALPAYALVGSLVAQVRGAGSNLGAQLPEAIGVNGGLLLSTLILAGFEHLSLRSFLSSFCVTVWAVVGCYVLMRRRTLGALVPLSWSRALSLLRLSGGSFLAVALTAVAVRAPLFLAGLFGGAAAAAILDVALRLGSLATITTSSVSATYSVPFASLLRQNDARRLKRALCNASLLASIPALVWLLMLYLSADALFASILPTAFQAASDLSVIVAIGYLFNALLGISTTALLMANKPQVVTMSSSLMLAIMAAGPLLVHAPIPMVISVCLAVGLLARDSGAMLYFLRRYVPVGASR